MTNDVLDLEGRVALVTGAGQGVGREIALHLAAHGSGGVAVNDYVLERAQAVVEEIEAAGGKAIAVQADVTDHDAVKAMVADVADRLGPVGCLVNNAGNVGANPSDDVYAPFWETGPETWQHMIAVNFNGVLNCTAAVIPGMIERKAPGRIITIISDASRAGDAKLAVYGGAKAGAAGFMRGVARAVGRYGVTANCISISATRTPAIEESLKDEKLMKQVFANYVVRRPGEPEEIAATALFLASRSAAWTTGQTYCVNGGFTLSL